MKKFGYTDEDFDKLYNYVCDHVDTDCVIHLITKLDDIQLFLTYHGLILDSMGLGRMGTAGLRTTEKGK